MAKISLSELLRAKYPATDRDTRMTAKKADYVELEGAIKDSDCQVVKVEGGVSSDLGCCDFWKRENKSVQEFKCGTCHFLEEE